MFSSVAQIRRRVLCVLGLAVAAVSIQAQVARADPVYLFDNP
ncbi:unnamed protein product, partial [marine sediment metagenome]